MIRKDKTYWSAWILLSVFLPMVLISSLHIHADYLSGTETCHDCMEHMVHNGHITDANSEVDCPLCAFQSNIYQPEEENTVPFIQPCTRLKADIRILDVSLGVIVVQSTRAPPFTSHA